MCSKHFRENDYQTETKDKNTRRKEHPTDGLKRKVLLTDAVPSIFPNLPEYYSKPVPERRSETTSKDARYQRQYEANEILVQEFLDADLITSFEKLKEKLDAEEDWPEYIFRYSNEEKITFYSMTENDTGRPVVKYSLIIKNDLHFAMWCNDIEIAPSKVAHICRNKIIDRSSSVLTIIVFLKNLSEERNVPSTTTIEYCVKILDKVIPELDDEKASKVSFLKEQLALSVVQKSSRRYSPNLLAYAALWENTSPALYKQILKEDILALPTQRHLKKLTSAFTVEAGMSKSTEQYLKTRIKNLSEREKIVNLMIDEVYSAKRVEYSGGTFYGYENQNVTKTLLCFMIKSVGGKYMDMVCMSPIDNLDSDILHAMWLNVLETLTKIGFDVVSDTVDGHSSNRKFYKEKVCGGTMKTQVPHPFKEGSWLFPLFDTVHVWKCNYNNFCNKKKFVCPDFDGLEVAPEMKHIEELYNLELGQPVKIAYKLTDKVLHPQPIEKTNVKLADALFHESTIAALEYYAERDNDKKEWKKTANYLRIIRTWWNIVNVKSLYSGQRTRDLVRSVISIDDMGSLEYLKKFVTWIEKWEEMGDKKHSLSSETFMTTKQTSHGLIALAIYLLEEKDFDYVLLGLITSDPIEKRFGWYRQLGGANYYLSVRQFLESEKKIRLQVLVKSDIDISFKDAVEILKAGQSSEDVEEEAKELLALLGEDFEIDFNVKNENGILYYVAGFLSRSELKRLSCASCKCLFAKSSESPEIHFDEDLGEERDKLLEQIN